MPTSFYENTSIADHARSRQRWLILFSLGLNPPRNENHYPNLTPGHLYATAHAQDPVKTSPQYYKVLLENDQVRVLEYRLKAGQKEPMHSHPAGVVYVLSGAKLKVSYADGRTEEKAAATGETIWRDPTTHAVENIGDTEAHAIAIDFKTRGPH